MQHWEPQSNFRAKRVRQSAIRLNDHTDATAPKLNALWRKMQPPEGCGEKCSIRQGSAPAAVDMLLPYHVPKGDTVQTFQKGKQQEPRNGQLYGGLVCQARRQCCYALTVSSLRIFWLCLVFELRTLRSTDVLISQIQKWQGTACRCLDAPRRRSLKRSFNSAQSMLFQKLVEHGLPVGVQTVATHLTSHIAQVHLSKKPQVWLGVCTCHQVSAASLHLVKVDQLLRTRNWVHQPVCQSWVNECFEAATPTKGFAPADWTGCIP